MNFPKPRKRHESTLDYTKGGEENSKILLKEKYDLLHWTDTVEIKTPNLFIPAEIAQHIGSLPYCKLAVSPNADYLAIINHSRLLNVYSIVGETVNLESSVQVLEDDFAEYCLIEYSASGSLLLSTRSSAQIDVFDHTGGYCYEIPLETPERNVDMMSAVSCLKTVANTDEDNDKFSDMMFVLQFNGQFSAFKIGRLSRYHQLWSVPLGIGLSGSFTLDLPENILFVACHYKNKKDLRSIGGLCTFRVVDSAPYVVPVKVPEINGGGWFTRLPFASSNYAYISSMSVSTTLLGKKLVAVSTCGDFFVFDVPSTDVSVYVEYISGPKPVQAIFVDEEDVCVLFDNGATLRSSIGRIRDMIHQLDTSDVFSQRSYLTVPCPRELFVLSGDSGSRALKEVANKRTSLAFRLWLFTLWESFKQLVGMAVGDAAAPLQMATHTEDLKFSLHHCPTRTLQELFEQSLNEKNYERAKVLASTYDTIDADVILKREWRDVCSSSDVTEEHVKTILSDISDKEWVADASLTCDVPSKAVQRSLIQLCSSYTREIPNSHTMLLHHCGRILEICEDVSLYLELRQKSLLDVAFELARRCYFTTLEKLFSQNLDILSPYLLEILNQVPTCVPFSRYQRLCPDRYGNLSFSIDEGENSKIMKNIASADEEMEQILEAVNIGNQPQSVPRQDMLKWIRQRCLLTDSECGITEHVFHLISFGIDMGLTELSNDLSKWEQFISYVNMCTLVNESFEMFSECTMEHIVNSLVKLTQSELIRNSEKILKLLNWRAVNNCDVSHAVSILLKDATGKENNSVNVLVEFRRQSKNLVNDSMVINVLCDSTVTGDVLLNALRSLGVCPEVASSLRALADRGVKPGFGRIWESLNDRRLATGILKQLAGCGQAETLDEWEMLRDEVIQLANWLYSNLITVEEVVEIVATAILLDNHAGVDIEIIKTILSLDDFCSVKAENRLNSKRSAELLLKLSNELMQDAVTRGDVKLSRSKFLADTAKMLDPKGAHEQLKFLELVDLIHELGSPMLPAVVKFTEPYELLTNIVNLEENYKQGKRCARLAVLLGISMPVATALSVCSLAAIKAGDQKCVKTYMTEIINKSKGGIDVVHKLCKEVMKINVLPSIMDDIYCCALLNAPIEELEETFDLIRKSRESLRQPCDISNIQPDQELVHDPFYTKIEFFKNEPFLDEKIAMALDNLSQHVTLNSLAELLAHQSATAALCTAMAAPSEDISGWTKNQELQRYEHALRYFYDKLTPRLVSAIPPSALISAASTLDENISPIDRLPSYGADRERFIEDSLYRKETIIGLAMCEEEVMFNDALALARDFKMSEWDVHMASLENALTSCSIAEAKWIIKTRGHLVKLRGKPDEFHAGLRRSVLPLIHTNEKFIAYLTLFLDDEPEKIALPSLKKLLEKKKDLNGKQLFTDANYLTKVILTMPDKTIIMLAEDLLKIPVGTEACEEVARVLLDGTDIRPPSSSLMVLFLLLNKDESAVIELVSSKSLLAEVQYLETHLRILEVLPNVSISLKCAVSERIKILTSNVVAAEHESSTSSACMTRRKH